MWASRTLARNGVLGNGSSLYLSRIPLRPRKHPLLEDDSRARLGDEGPDFYLAPTTLKRHAGKLGCFRHSPRLMTTSRGSPGQDCGFMKNSPTSAGPQDASDRLATIGAQTLARKKRVCRIRNRPSA